MSNVKKNSTIKFFHNESNDNQNNIKSMNLNTELNFYNNDNHNTFHKRRNFSLNKNINKIIPLQYNIINKNFNHYSINRLNIDLGQISKLPFEKLVKLSERYMKTDK